MNYRNLLAGLAAGLLFYAQTGAELAMASVPKDAPKDIKYILGFYYGNGENIKTIRKSKGLSQEELAVKVNVVRQTVSKWEKGVSHS